MLDMLPSAQRGMCSGQLTCLPACLLPAGSYVLEVCLHSVYYRLCCSLPVLICLTLKRMVAASH